MARGTSILATALVASLCLANASTAFAKRDEPRRLVLNFKGADDAPVQRLVPVMIDLEDGLYRGRPMMADCFSADVVDLQTGRWLGTAEDCLTPLPDGARTSAYSGSGEQVVGTTIFNLRQGRLVIQGMTSVQAVNWPTENADGQLFTHVTGANSPADAVLLEEGELPFPEYDDLRNTGRFRNLEAIVRLSGQVDLSTPGRIAFDCIFVVDLR